MQARRRTTGQTRSVRPTLTIVCEGDAEVCLVRHLRSLYLGGSVGVSLSHKNAHGRGGQRALDLALRHRVNSSADVIGILIDTDQDWGHAHRHRARSKGVRVVESDPCLEAWLLKVAGYNAPAATADCKRHFERQFGCEAHDPRVYVRNFSRPVLDAARAQVPALDQLLTLMGA